jgi:flagellar biosynthesis anti-sigma factor FlgM
MRRIKRSKVVKIDANRLTQDAGATEATKRATGDQRVQKSGVERPADKRDRVEVSPDAQLLTAAHEAAQKAPAIRTELVERLKQKLNSGELGNDADALADRLIDDVLGK